MIPNGRVAQPGRAPQHPSRRGISPIETGFHGMPGDEAQGRFDEAFEILRLELFATEVMPALS